MASPLVSWNRLLNFFLKRVVLILTLMFCIGAGIALSNMSRLSSNLIEAQAVQSAALYVESFNQTIELYSTAAADRAKTGAGMEVTHAYLNKPGAIPLPSTFAIELGDRISERDDGVGVRFYSDYPFPWREEGGGPKNSFEQEALDYLRQNPQASFFRREDKDGHGVMRYGEASIMKASCVTCHNTHPKSPKTDWEVGDVGGVWEITQSLDNLVAKVDRSLKGTFAMLSGFSLLGISGLTLVFGKLRQNTRELEGRVKSRTADLAQANGELEQRNSLIRQVFGRYLSDAVVANLLERPEGLRLGGDRRMITILTSDLRGFTSLSERLAPESVIQVLNLYLEEMAEVINQYQGTIDEFMGDGILVLFGAPTAGDDDALRAVACACAMQLKMGAVNERLKQMNLAPLEMGIGINTGEVVVGNIGSERRTKYGIVGSPVNLAYRIESYTSGGQILIAEATLHAAGASVKTSRKRQVQPKGVQQPLTIYEVYGVGGFHNLYLPKSELIWATLDKPILLRYALIDGKQISSTLQRGRLIRLSGQSGIVQVASGASLPPEFTNLKLNLELEHPEMRADLYAKVGALQPEQDCFRIEFTAIPPAVQQRLEQIYQNR
ncbi:MAG: adenylate/guanylate cyclase domain-containing protein [Pegethrix bostrychoides GSE-TBD4-15B]|jgi:adenylate cyclase|uniref:Adenylate/guanylate cyclase domain-containing protein n=1 Tax=Pegethrix bostrychoides GSE-TBD4-15B TaxID=2839662 RepID=A0A951PCA5_9CYAN|nr:adenylate/guanylate cyclase domain-containing protein [Pegethrix bostrychoides GSE-TBD4-15B]